MTALKGVSPGTVSIRSSRTRSLDQVNPTISKLDLFRLLPVTRQLFLVLSHSYGGDKRYLESPLSQARHETRILAPVSFLFSLQDKCPHPLR